ncbi:unnamed protein product [Rotaria sordida]|uniref:Uncharacterized protein n=2 Tax=Rotaria sordida TaxID=392033 RepID=A0A819UF32_9BILA|nr:unnamed protein product [Rotaria sordida]
MFYLCLYEYDSEEQFFGNFFSRYRTELQKLITSFIGMFFLDIVAERSIVVETNMSSLQSILQSLLAFLESLVQRTPTKTDNEIQTSLSSIYLITEWAAFQVLIDHVLFIFYHNYTINNRNQFDLIHLNNNNNNSLSQTESLDEQLRKANTRRSILIRTTYFSNNPSTSIENK